MIFPSLRPLLLLPPPECCYFPGQSLCCFLSHFVAQPPGLPSQHSHQHHLPPPHDDTKPTPERGLPTSPLRAHSFSTPKLPETEIFPPHPPPILLKVSTTQPAGGLWPRCPSPTPLSQAAGLYPSCPLSFSAHPPDFLPALALVTSLLDPALTLHLLSLPQASPSHPSSTPLGAWCLDNIG